MYARMEVSRQQRVDEMFGVMYCENNIKQQIHVMPGIST